MMTRREVVSGMAIAGLGLAAGGAQASTYYSILSPVNIWNRRFNPNSALKNWSIMASGDLSAPSRLRFELRPGDVFNSSADITNKRERAELSGIDSPFTFDRNYTLTTSFKLSGYTGASSWLIFTQILQNVSGTIRPVLGLEVRDSLKWQVVVRNGSNPSAEIVMYSSSAPLAQNVLHTLVLKMNVGLAGPSLLYVELDGQQVVNDHQAPMGFATGSPPYFKMGLYRPASSDRCVMFHSAPVLA
jgi:hypothetical protein